MKKNKDISVIEYGDFQTPIELAKQVVGLLRELNIKSLSIVEPTCGKGAFVSAAIEGYREAEYILGIDIDEKYISEVKSLIPEQKLKQVIELETADFYTYDWEEKFDGLKEPILVIGNPPWVTNSVLGSHSSTNLPLKNNFLELKGLEAITGSANFDIAEWMLIRLMESINQKEATLAMLCKFSTARKLFAFAQKSTMSISDFSVYKIDTKKHFQVSVDACLFLCSFHRDIRMSNECKIFDNLESKEATKSITYRNGNLILDEAVYDFLRSSNEDRIYHWRSGVKHDAAKIMEIVKSDDGFINGNGEKVDIEEDLLFPMFKGSDIANNRLERPRKWVIITQTKIGEDTNYIKEVAPKTWKYLTANRTFLNQRSSSIYKDKPLFSIFGIGDYSFAKWKVSIAGMYKILSFVVLGEYDGKSAMIDDTSYFISCDSKKEAMLVYDVLTSKIAQKFFNSIIFWDAKRPITKKVLDQLDIMLLAKELGLTELVDIMEKKQNKNSLLFTNIG